MSTTHTVPKYAIVAQLFNDTQTVFRLKSIGEDRFIDKSANAIYQEPDILMSLSSEDAHLIGYVCAAERVLLDMKCFFYQ